MEHLYFEVGRDNNGKNYMRTFGEKMTQVEDGVLDKIWPILEEAWLAKGKGERQPQITVAAQYS